MFGVVYGGVIVHGRLHGTVPHQLVGHGRTAPARHLGNAAAEPFPQPVHGQLHAGDLAAGLTGAVVKDPVQDRVVWLEYLQTVVKERDGWKDLYRACQEVL